MKEGILYSPNSRQGLRSPQIETALKMYDQKVGTSPSFTEQAYGSLQKTLDFILEYQLANIAIHEHEGVKVPYTVIRVNELAKRIVADSDLPQVPLTDSTMPEDEAKIHHKRVFVSQSVLAANTSGYPLTYQEKTLTYALRELTYTVDQLRNGETIDRDTEIYTFGSPTSLWGEIPSELPQKIKEDGFAALAPAYSSFVESSLPEDETARKNTTVRIDGWSMGAHIAIDVADDLIIRGVVANETEPNNLDSNLPRISILAENPSGVDHGVNHRGVKIKLGFAGEMVAQGAAFIFGRNPSLAPAFQEGAFVKDLKAYLATRRSQDPNSQKIKDKSIVPYNDPEQIKLKKAAVREMINALGKGIPINSIRARTYIRRGINDPTRFDLEWRRAAIRRLETSKNSLVQVTEKSVTREKEVEGETVTFQHPIVREYPIRMSHSLPLLRDNILARWGRQADVIMGARKPLHKKKEVTEQ